MNNGCKSIDFLFDRSKPQNKLTMIKHLDTNTLCSVPEHIILKCIKQAGTPIKEYRRFKNAEGSIDHRWITTRRKELHIEDANGEKPRGSHSAVYYVYEGKEHKVWINFNIWGDDIDTEDEITYRNGILSCCECWGKLHEEFRNGYAHDVPANFDNHDKGEVVRAILLTYVKNKYHDKLMKVN